MTGIKPINFKPKLSDKPVIDLLMESGEFKSASDLVRTAIWKLAIEKFGDDLTAAVGNDIAEDLFNQYKE